MKTDLALEIMRLAMEVTRQKKHTVFAYYMGHCNILTVRSFLGAWNQEKKSEFDVDLWLEPTALYKEKDLVATRDRLKDMLGVA